MELVWVFIAVGFGGAGVAILTDFRGVSTYFYRREARSLTKAGISELEYSEAISSRTYRYTFGTFLCAAAVFVLIAVALGFAPN